MKGLTASRLQIPFAKLKVTGTHVSSNCVGLTACIQLSKRVEAVDTAATDTEARILVGLAV